MKPRDSFNEAALLMQAEPAFEEAFIMHVEAAALIANITSDRNRSTLYSHDLCLCYVLFVHDVLHPRGHGSANTCSSTCTLSPAGSLQSFRRDPLRDKIREVGRGLSLADTQTGRYGRLYSRRRLCARRGADARRSSESFSTFSSVWPNPKSSL